MNHVYGHYDFRPGDPVPLEELRRLDRIASGVAGSTITGVGAAGAEGLQVLAPVGRVGFWARVTGNVGASITFMEVQDISSTSTYSHQDVVGGMTGTAREVNGNASIPVGAVVWVWASEQNEAWTCFYPAGGSGSGGALSLNVNVFSASGTWSKPAGLVFAEVEVVGGGGGGGSAPPGSSATSGGAGGGGGGGEYRYGVYNAASLSASETVTVGSGGAGGSGGGTNSGAGGSASSFGAHITANGGAGGQSSGLVSGADHVTGRALSGSGGSGGTLAVNGTPAEPGVVLWDGTTLWLNPGRGGSTPLGSAGTPNSGAIGSTTDGVNGTGYGSGGSGAIDSTGGTGGTGGSGAGGVVIVREWTSSGSGGGTTGTNGMASLGTSYIPTSTMANVGLSVTLPNAGTYLLWATINANVNNPTVQDEITARLYDTTNAAAVTPATVILEDPVGGGNIDGTTTIQTLYTTPSASTVIDLQARNPIGAGTISSAGLTVLGYVQLA